MSTLGDGAGGHGDLGATRAGRARFDAESGEMMIAVMLHDPWGRGRPEI
jgi:hypothetical protein